MIWRVLITLAAWAVGVLFGFFTDGKSFDASLWVLTSAAVASMPWFSLPPPSRMVGRRIGIGILSLNGAVFVTLLVFLPESHSLQRSFEEQARSAQSVPR
jgi:hypothetical protein